MAVQRSIRVHDPPYIPSLSGLRITTWPMMKRTSADLHDSNLSSLVRLSESDPVAD